MPMLWWTCFVATAWTLVDVRAFSAPVQNAKPAPYMCQLRSTPELPMKCHGVLVDANFALFSRRCMDYHETGDSVVVGPSRIDGGRDDGDWIPISWIMSDEQLDFSMVLLSRPAKAKPVQILWDDLEPGTMAWMRGWYPFNGDNASKVLLETTVQVISNDQCIAKIKSPFSHHFVCGDNDGFPDCTSYFFGSLFVDIGGKEFIVGIMAFFSCFSVPVIQIFSRMSAGRTFVEQHLCLGG